MSDTRDRLDIEVRRVAELEKELQQRSAIIGDAADEIKRLNEELSKVLRLSDEATRGYHAEWTRHKEELQQARQERDDGRATITIPLHEYNSLTAKLREAELEVVRLKALTGEK